MRHRMKGRKLGRNASHRHAMFRNMAASLIRTVRVDESAEGAPKTPGRIVTTVAKAKELRPYVEKLVTLAKKALPHEEQAREFATSAEPNTEAWRQWRNSETWEKWAQAKSPAVGYRRRAFALLRDKEAVDILFSELGERFRDRSGGYTRIVRLAKVRLGDAGPQALIEFVGERDRARLRRAAPLVVEGEEPETQASSPVDEVPSEEATTAGESAAEESALEESAGAENAGEERSEEENK